MFTRNPNEGGKCFMRAITRIIQRFVRIRCLTDYTTPLALYSSVTNAEPRFITSKDIEAVMRRVASRVYNIDPVKGKEALQRWSAHSLRVGACVILHAMGFTDTQIQWLLRWHSLAFMVYLQNTYFLASRQNLTLDMAGAMPHIFNNTWSDYHVNYTLPVMGRSRCTDDTRHTSQVTTSRTATVCILYFCLLGLHTFFLFVWSSATTMTWLFVHPLAVSDIMLCPTHGYHHMLVALNLAWSVLADFPGLSITEPLGCSTS